MLANSPIVYMFLYVRDIGTARQFYEGTLGLPILELEGQAVKYDAGEIVLALNVASDFGITLDDEQNRSQLIVFHVEDIDAKRQALEDKGVSFMGPTERYEIGATATFFDPDGHCILLYELSEESMTWPSAEKIREILAANSRDQTILRVLSRHRSASPDAGGEPRILADNKVLYIFNFVTDFEESKDFYGRKLGLRVLEEDKDVGVVKYDGGGVLLSTHLVETQSNAPRKEHMDAARTSSLVFLCGDVSADYQRLREAGVDFDSGVIDAEIGKIARFHDPNGHFFYLYEPSPAAMSWPSGAKIGALAGQSAGVQ